MYVDQRSVRRILPRRAMVTAALCASALVLGGLTPTFAHAATCGGTAYATPFHPGRESVSQCGVFGHPGYQQPYSWSVGAESSGRACVDGWGFDAAHPGGTWFPLGCGTRGAGTVPWGNVLARPRIRAQSLNVPLGCYVDW